MHQFVETPTHRRVAQIFFTNTETGVLHYNEIFGKIVVVLLNFNIINFSSPVIYLFSSRTRLLLACAIFRMW